MGKQIPRLSARLRDRRPFRSSRCELLESRHLLAARVVINELMYHAPSGRDHDEWIELYNAGDAPINVLGMRFTEGVDYTLPEATLGPGDFLVVAADVDAFRALYPDVDNVVGGWSGRLSNRSETVELVDAAGNLVDVAKYADSGEWAARRRSIDGFGVPSWEWVTPHDGLGFSAELANPNLPRDLGHNWIASSENGGTPGRANQAASADIAPAITDVAHDPVIPTSSDQVAITARIVDERQPAVQATLYYRESTLTPGNFLTTAMFDDGQHGDEFAGDGIFGAFVPALANETVVEFYIEAIDAGGARRTSPAPTDDAGGQEANYLYQVDDTERPADIPLFRTVMTVADRNAFNRQVRDSDALSNATFVVTIGDETEFRYNAGVRYRGSGTRNNPVPNNRINLPSDRPWDDTTQLNINANAPHNQIAGSTLFSLAELPAADAIPVRMLSNERDLARGGFYAYVEVLNGDWADRHFPNDSQGNVYRGRRAGEGPPGGLGAGLAYLGDNPAFYVSYVKGTNSSQADYFDVIELTDVLNNTPDAEYLQEVERVANVDQWLRAIATIDLVGYAEFSLLNGDAGGDDYAMYRGVDDPRFMMIPYDMDEMFSATPLLRAINVPALNRLLNHPEIRPRYAAQVLDLVERSLTPERVRAALQEVLGTVRVASQLESIVNFLVTRGRSMRNSFPTQLTVEVDYSQVDGFYRANDLAVNLSGEAHNATTRRVEVNGIEAQWDGVTGQWALSSIPLAPGFNRLEVISYDRDGRITETRQVDIFREATAALAPEAIAEDTTWTAADGPYQIDGELRIMPGATLTIEPGTAVWFANNAQLIVEGRLVSEGTPSAPVWFSRTPGSEGTWNGLQFRGSSADNRIEHAVLQYGETDDGMIGLEDSRLTVQHTTLAHTRRRRIRSIDSSLVVRHSTFATIAAPGQAPLTDNLSEHVWGRGIPPDGEWILENNFFGHTTGHNDLIDFDAPRLPNPIPIIRNNIFAGSGDDALDMTGDVYIEGNLFENFRKDEFNLDPGQSNTISASSGTYFVIGNIFRNVQHASLVKENAFMHFVNNTVVQSESAPLYFDLPGQTSGPGIGARVEGSVFHGVGTLFDQLRPTTELTLNYSFVPPDEVARGTGNLTGEPYLDLSDSRLDPLPGSPLIGAGPQGTTLGAPSSFSAVITRQPPPVTAYDVATLTVGGVGIVNYRYRVNDGPWSEPRTIETPIELTDLADGDYSVEVIGENLIGRWQDQAEAVASRVWQVDSTLAGVRINEVLASNRTAVERSGAFPDLIELYNFGRSAVDLSNMSITDDVTMPRRFVFPPGTTLAGGEYLVLIAGDVTTAPGLHLGFALSDEGEGVYLFDAPSRGGQMIDQVEFGRQAADLSIGVGDDFQWTITRPTLGAANESLPQSSPQQLQINEWLASADVSMNNDFIELFNSGFGPIDLGGVLLTDSPISWPQRHELAPLSVIGGGGYAAFEADGDPEDGRDHLNFRLSRLGDMVGLYTSDLQEIDLIHFAAQLPDVSEGFTRQTDGSRAFTRFELPTPGLANPAASIGQENLVPLDAIWRFDQTDQDLGSAWREPDFDDSAWAEGQAAFFAENAQIPAPKNTPLELGAITYYFRHEFSVDDPSAVESLALTSVIDDGMIVYVNGTEVFRLGLPNGDVQHSTTANRTVNNAAVEGPFAFPADVLVPGRNVVAVELHQQNVSSLDVVMAIRLDAQVRRDDLPAYRALALQRDLRITEVMYNPLGNEEYEFIEVQNIGSQPLQLEGMRFDQGVDFVFPNMELGPGEFAVVVSNIEAFRRRYGNLARVAGQYDRNLSNSGEAVRLTLPEPYPTTIVEFEYSIAWYPETDGRGFSLVIDDPLGPRRTWENPAAWRPSNFVNGSPGFEDAGLDVGILRINEILAHTSGAAGDQIEILNTTSSPLDISGWYLSNDAANLTKYRFAQGVVIPPEQSVVFTAADHFGGQFTLADLGGEVLLASPDAVGSLAGFIVRQEYGTTDAEMSWGRYVRSDGSEDFVLQSTPSLGQSNAGPFVDSLVISEFDFSPAVGEEFVELHNRDTETVVLAAPGAPDRTWSIDGDLQFTFPAGVSLAPGGYLLVVAGDPEAFRQTHSIGDDIPIFGPFSGSLNDSAGEIRLLRPLSLQPDVNLIVDRVQYSDQSPWPAEAGEGPSPLIRVPLDAYGNDPASWAAGIAYGTPGSPNEPIDTTPASAPSDLTWQVATGPEVRINWVASTDPETGVVRYNIYRDETLIGSTATTEFVDASVTAPATYRYQVTAVNGQGLESEASPMLDVGMMSIESVNSRFNNQVVVRFTEPVTPESAQQAENYQIEGVQVLGAQLAADGQTLSIVTSPLTLDVPYRLTTQNIVGVAGSPLPPGLEFPFSYREGVPGFTVHGIQSRQRQLRSLADLDELLSEPPDSTRVARQVTDIYAHINFRDDDGHAPTERFADNIPFPTDLEGGEDNFLIHATGFLIVPPEQAGTWTFGANVDAPQTTQSYRQVIARGSEWKYSDTGQDWGVAWRDADFDDAAWASGQAPFGYGDGDETTRLNYGPDADHRIPTYYFRTTFSIDSPADIVRVRGALQRDDGAAVYVNGVEVARHNLAPNAAFGDLAPLENVPPFESAAFQFEFDPSLLRQGENVVAVEVHQSSAAGEDIRFDLGLETLVEESSSTDGFRLIIDGNPVIVADAPHGASARLGTVELSPGAHSITFDFFEATEGANVELFAAPGSHRSLNDTDAWRLVGDRAGGLSVTTDPSPPTPLAWTALTPDGALLERAATHGTLKGSDIPLGYSVNLRSGEVISAIVEPDNREATLTVRLRDSLQTLQTWRTDAAGAPLIITGAVAGDSDQYVLEISSDTATGFELNAFANALTETERKPSAVTNDTAATAQDLGAPRMSVLGSEQWAVHGESDADGSADFYKLALAQGETISAAAAWDQAVTSRLELLSPNLELVAVGVDDGTSNVIADFRVPLTGTYYVRVTHAEAAGYRLALIRGAGMDAARNESPSTASPMSPTLSVIGSLRTEFAGPPTDDAQTTPIPLVLTDGEGFQWNTQPEGYQSFVPNGAYDYGLYLPGATYVPEGTLEENGRELILGPSQPQTGLTLTRKIYVSPSLGFVRYLEVFTNTGTLPTTWSGQILSDFGSDAATQLVATSSGDLTFDNADHWLITDDADGRADPTLLHIFSGPGGQPPTMVDLTNDQFALNFALELDPGETQIFMHFAAQNSDRLSAQLKAAILSDLSGGALAGMSMDEIASVVNFQIDDVIDSYSVYLTAGQEVTWTTQTPSDDDVVRRGAPIDPALTLLDPDGNEVATDDNSADDGRNARLTWTAAADGFYVIQVASRAGGGAYRLTSTSVSEPPLVVADSEPPVGLPVGGIPSSWRLDFSSAVDLSTIDPADLSINDLPATTVELVDGNSLRFTVDPALFAGAATLTVSLAENALTSYGGRGNQRFTETFVVDPVAPRVANVSWNQGDLPDTRLLTAGPVGIELEFDEPIRQSSLDTDDVRILSNATGEFITPWTMDYDEATHRLRAQFFLSEGDYTLVVASGDGAIEDIAGNDLDGDSTHGQVPSGDSMPGGDYRVPFRVDELIVDLSPRWSELRPAGSLAARNVLSETIAYPDDVDSYQAQLSPGDRLSIAVDLLTANPDSGMYVEVRDPWGRIVARTAVGSDGRLPHIDDLHSSTGGFYQIRVTGGDVGESYGLTLLRNAVEETNDSSARRPAAIDESAPNGPARRYAVLGASRPVDPEVLVWGVQPSSGRIVVVDPLTGDIAFSFAAPGTLAPTHTRIGLAMADLGQTLLYVNSDDDPTRIFQLDPMTGEIRGTLAVESGGYDGLGLEGGKLFLARRGADIVRQTVAGDPPIGAWTAGTVRGGLGGDDYGRIFGLFDDGTIREFDPNTSSDEPRLSIATSMDDLEGLAFDGTRLYASSASGRLVTFVPDEPGSPAVHEVTVEGGALFGLASHSEFTGSSSGNGDGEIAEQEPNNSRGGAQSLDGAFSLAMNDDIGDLVENTSTRIPHVTVRGRGTGNADFYSFTVTRANTRGLFDVDNSNDSFDPYLRLRDPQGNIVAESDDAQLDEGSTTSLDSFIDYSFTAVGVYTIEVGSCCVGDVPTGARYNLHVSVESAVMVRGTDVDLIATGSQWGYWNQTASPPDNWAAPEDSNDADWTTGRGQLGYGDGDEQTVVSFVPDGNERPLTTYYRKTITIDDVDAFDEFWVDLLYDDAAAVYVNGQLAFADNLPVPFDASSPAVTVRDGNVENTYQRFPIDAALLRAGTNVIAVEIHQSSDDDADLSFDLRLQGRVERIISALPSIDERDVYTVDLSGSVGRTIDIVLAGQQGARLRDARLRLLDAAGQVVLAEATPADDSGPTNFDLAIRDFVVPGDGLYTIVLESSVAGSYLVLVTDGAAFDTEPNGADVEMGRLRTLANGQAALGMVDARGPSAYVDAQGDMLPNSSMADIAGLSAQVVDDELIINVDFHHSIQPSSPTASDGVFIYIELDTDQDVSTGVPSFQNQGFVPGQTGGPMGIELAINASSSVGEASLFNPRTGQFVATLPLTLTDTAFRLAVPLAQLGDDGMVNLGVISGRLEVSDAAPNTTFLTSQVGGGQIEREQDGYRIAFNEGETYHVSVQLLPGLDGGHSEGTFALLVLDGAGNVVASDHVTDGRPNADVLVTAPATGDYRVVVETSETAVRYVLRHEQLAGPAVLRRHLFYNHSALDGDSPDANEADDAAIAWDKRAQRPGSPMRFEHVSSFAHGINGIMVDLYAAPGPLSLEDFTLRVGNGASPDAWAPAPAPAAFLVRPGAGAGGSDRVTIIWEDRAIRDEWLEVTIRATNATGLSEPDVFYFGSLVGETGDSLSPMVVSSHDRVAVQRAAGAIGASLVDLSAFDIDRDGRVDAQDVALTSSGSGRPLEPVFGIEPGEVDPMFASGDANLDGRFDIDDLMLSLQRGTFEDLFAGNSTWSDGDWDGDGDFTTRDLVLAFQQGAFHESEE